MEILFKAKRLDGDEWIESMTISKGTTKRKSRDLFIETSENRWKGVKPETICQFTGFTHNKKKVFQDDTFKVWLEDSVKELGGYWWNVEVKQHLGCWILAQIGHDYKDTPIEQCELLFTTDYELIPTGNIHDKK